MYLAVRAEGNSKRDAEVKADSYISLSQSGPGHQEDHGDSSSVQEEFSSSGLNILKVQLTQAEETAHKVQREVTPSVSATL